MDVVEAALKMFLLKPRELVRASLFLRTSCLVQVGGQMLDLVAKNPPQPEAFQGGAGIVSLRRILLHQNLDSRGPDGPFFQEAPEIMGHLEDVIPADGIVGRSNTKDRRA